MGGPAHHVGILGGTLDPERYETLLLHGSLGAGEDSLEESVRARGASLQRVPGLRPEVRPHDDARALAHMVREVRRLRPDIVHTHTAKAGIVGRLGAVLAGQRPRPKIVHTYHGHVLEGYFGPLRNGTYRFLERRLGAVSDRLIGVSNATVADLVRLGIADRSKFRVIPVGLDLDPFLASKPEDGAGFRQEAGVTGRELLLTFVGRLVPIKRVDVLLRAFRLARGQGRPLRLALVGDGELRPELERLAHELGVATQVWFAGYRADVRAVAAGSDIAVLSSDNEGTPVSLIEAGAAGKPAVATRVGGVPEVVTSASGLLAPPGDPEALADALVRLVEDPELREQMGRDARKNVEAKFSARRLVDDIDRLYRDLLDPSPPSASSR
jgi:glycosyltransferase involved in cell wall biosynthesis